MNRLKITLFLSLAVITACSNDSNTDKPAEGDTNVADDSGASTGDASNTGVNAGSAEPSAVPLSCSISQGRIKNESGFEGDIFWDCKGGSGFNLVPGADSLNIIDLQALWTSDLSCPDGYKSEGHSRIDYKTGVVTHYFTAPTINGPSESGSCTTMFISPLEAVIVDNRSIFNLVFSFAVRENDASFISSDCFDGDTGNLLSPPNRFSCTETNSQHYTFTDHNGKIHRLSMKQSGKL